jgi:tetratricopeptide (TPR) repeat protein
MGAEGERNLSVKTEVSNVRMMARTRLPRLMLLAFLAFSSFSAFAAPRLSPDPRIPDSAAQAAVMGREVFGETALVASGADEAEAQALSLRMSGLSKDLLAEIRPEAGGAEKAEAVLGFLYGKLLSRYSEYQTRVDVALDTGEYNCVSSAILFAYFAKAAGLAVEGVETPEHAFCTVAVDGKKIDVETTNPYGFDPGSRKALPDAASGQRQYAVIPQTMYYGRKAIDDRRFVSLVYLNRIAALERRGAYEEAVGLAVDAWRLQGGAMPTRDLAGVFLNYAVSLSRAGRETEALDFIRGAASAYGDYPDYRVFAAATVGNMVNDLMRGNAFGEASRLVSAYRADIGPDAYAQMGRAIALATLYRAADSSPLGETLAQIDGSRDFLAQADYERLLTYAYSKEAERLARTGKWLEAASVIDGGLRSLPRQPELLSQRATFRGNYAIEVHNSAVSAYRAGDTDGARAILAEGLRLVPESALLEEDLGRMR